MTIYCFADKMSGCEALASKISEVSREVLSKQHSFSLVLSGGSTPQHLYKLLASSRWRDEVQWSKTHIFFGDERCVPPGHPDSNFKMAWESMLKKLPIPKKQIHRIHGEESPEVEAIRYQSVIKTYFSGITNQESLFDLTLLGLGSDGHTASLFPKDETLKKTGLVAAVAAPAMMEPAVNRISMTLTGIGLTKNICFLVDGAAKTKIVKEVLRDDIGRYPAAMVQGEKTIWYLSGMDCSDFKIIS